MSQDSISSELERELLESQTVHQKLLDYSRQTTTLILPSTMDQEMWTVEEMSVLLEYQAYYKKMMEIIEQAKTKGPQNLPKKPKRKLEELFKEKKGDKKRRKDISTPQELHDYLVANLANIRSAISREAFSNQIFSPTTDEGEIVERLNKGVRNLRKQDAQTLLFYIQFGHFLILCKQWQESQRKEGIIKETWASWLKAKTGYSDVHARKLRAVANVLYGYPGFYVVGLPFRFIYGKLNEIKIMLQMQEFAQFWRQDPLVPSTTELQQSQ